MTDEVDDAMLDLLNMGIIEIAGFGDDGEPLWRIVDESRLDSLIASVEGAVARARGEEA